MNLSKSPTRLQVLQMISALFALIKEARRRSYILVRSSVFSTFDVMQEEFVTVLFRPVVVFYLLQDEFRLSFLLNPVTEIFFAAWAEGSDSLDPFKLACDFEDTIDLWEDRFLPL